METVCETNLCTGCMACVEACPKDAIRIHDSLQAYNAIIDETKCVNCNVCHKICQVNYPVTLVEPKIVKQGWLSNTDLRSRGSSGGIGGALLEAFNCSGGSAYSCEFNEGKFKYSKVSSKSGIECFAGSKYVKSSPLGIYKDIHNELSLGNSVLFIGLPCHVAALRKFCVGVDEKLYTADLICHGTPSPEILNRFLLDYNINLSDLEDIKFRYKDNFHVYVNNHYSAIVPENVTDMYTYAFLNGISYTENCYHCHYADIHRVSDMTIGDSWGTLLSAEERGKGISLILFQTEKGMELLSYLDMELFDVDLERAINANHQLKAPSVKPKERDTLFKCLEEGVCFDKAMKRSVPKAYFKQKLKKLLIQTHLWGGVKPVPNYGVYFLGK